MLEHAMERIGYTVAKFRFRNDPDILQSFSGFMTESRSALIALPLGYDEAVLASNAIRAFRDRLMHLKLTVLHQSTRATSLADYPKCEVIRIDPHDLNRFSLPTRRHLRRVLDHPYDVAMDLNLDFVLHTAYICKATRARVRLGLAHDASDTFFNVQFHATPNRAPRAVYEKFASCLSMF